MYKNNFKVVAFDLDNTLYDENQYFEAVLKKFCSFHDFKTELFIDAFYKIKRTSGDIFGEVLKLMGVYTKNYQEELFGIYQSIDITITPYPEVLNLLNLLKNKSIGTAIITNGVIKAQQNKIKSLKLENEVDLIIYARKWGKEFEKPHSKPFEYLMNYFACLPNEVLFIGDNEENDIKAAYKVGINTFKIDDPGQLFSAIKYINNGC